MAAATENQTVDTTSNVEPTEAANEKHTTSTEECEDLHSEAPQQAEDSPAWRSSIRKKSQRRYQPSLFNRGERVMYIPPRQRHPLGPYTVDRVLQAGETYNYDLNGITGETVRGVSEMDLRVAQ